MFPQAAGENQMPASPIQMVYMMQVPANANGGHNLRGEVEYQLSDMVNPVTLYANPDALAVFNATLANFTSGPTNGMVPLTVYFTNLSIGAESYSWDFRKLFCGTASEL